MNDPHVLDRPALWPHDWDCIENFQEALLSKKLEFCLRCRERWFGMKLTRGGVCDRCRRVDSSVAGDPSSPFLYSADNQMDPGDVPDLPELTEIEEQLIARVHVAVQVRQVRGQQYKYSGHVVNFLRDTARVYNELPLLPADLDIVVLRPSNANSDERLNRQFRQDCRVRRGAVSVWLDYLQNNHPAYRDITVDEFRLSQLPPNADVLDQLQVFDDDDVAVGSAPDNGPHDVADDASDDAPSVATAVPDIMPTTSEMDQLRRQFSGEQSHLNMPPFRSTPIAEFDTAQPVLSWAFPTLYPRGEADFSTPRLRSVSFSNYAKHLMKFHDGRFARHPRWRYVVFNTLMRRQSSQRAGFFARKSDQGNLSREELRELFEGDTSEANALTGSIVSFSSAMRGTPPYWAARRRELAAYVSNLGSPHLFVTLSAADLHWHDLMRHMPHFEEWLNGRPDVRNRIARINLRDNPHIAAYWFHARFQEFKENVLEVKFSVTDAWSRYEWQGRGSSHTHGLYWLSDAPNSDFDPLSDAQRQVFANQWGIVIQALNPEPQRRAAPFEERSPLSLPRELQTNNVRYLSAILNRVQRHTCATSYCLRVNSNTGESYCRFHFPVEVSDSPELRKPPGSTYFRLFPARNDPAMNNYSRLLSMAWQANTDVNPCTGRHAVVHYVSKYVTKNEEQTVSYKDMMRRLLPNVNSGNPLLSAVTKLMNKLIGERDWSAQEICHLLLGLPLHQGSRTIISVDLRPKEEHDQYYSFSHEGDADETNTVRAGKSWLDKYEDRPGNLSDLAYVDFLRYYDVRQHRDGHPSYRRLGKARVLKYFPVYDEKDQFEDYARAKLTLNHPFRDVTDLLRTPHDPDELYPDFSYAYNHTCGIAHGHHSSDCYGRGLPEDPEQSQRVELDEEDSNVLSWMDISGELPNRPATRIEDVNDLGARQLDREYNWAAHIGRHPGLEDDFWHAKKMAYPADTTVSSSGTVDGLEDKQRLLYDMVYSHYTDVLRDVNPPQLLINLDGKAGTGKSHLIMLLSSVLQNMARHCGRPNPIIRAAPTGVAAHGIGGRTMHALFRLPVGSSQQGLTDLSDSNRQSLQATFHGVKYLVLDEKSMINLKQLSWIDRRCRQIFPEHGEQRFGGLSIILSGDFCQLPPVLGRALFHNQSTLKNLDEINGCALYHSFVHTIELDVVRRQDGADARATEFREALLGLRDQTLTFDHWKTLSSRVQSVLPADIGRFADALRIYFRKSHVRQFNHDRLRDLRRPVLAIKASHEGSQAEKASADVAGNLHATLPLSVGTRVMLTENIWVERGLVNGSMGTLCDFVWPSSTDPLRMGPPSALLVHFDHYEGPCLYTTNDGLPVVPIFRSKRDFYYNSANCARQQFPLTVAYAITVHKSQGLTVPRAVLDIADREFNSGLRYVAVSRVKSLDGLLFDRPFDFGQIRSNPSSTVRMRQADERRRREQHVSPSVIRR